MAHILLVDDDKELLYFVQKVLEAGGHSVQVAADVLGALDKLANWPFDLVISDAGMPLYSGFDLIKTIRREKKYDSIGIVMLTGRREKDSVERAIRLGIDDYILKPIDPLLFSKKIDSLLKLRPEQEQSRDWMPQVSATAPARISFKLDLISISEEGVIIQSPYPLPIGELVQINSDLFTEIGIVAPQFRIFSSSQPTNQPSVWHSRLLFFAGNEAMLKKIRAWMVHHSTRAIRKAS